MYLLELLLRIEKRGSMANKPSLSEAAVKVVCQDAPHVVASMNEFTAKTFRTRGGRLGSGMGSLLEALWVYHMNNTLSGQGGVARECEFVWLPDHQPADFACIIREADWKPESREGELFRIEAKSMNLGVDEAKGHFTNLASETNQFDHLLVLLWSWTEHDKHYVWPKVHSYFLGPSLPIILMRDRLHLARGGSFVETGACPDACSPAKCTHVGEPLNDSGKRERRSGPATRKPKGVDYAANFGGLVRMLKTNGKEASGVFRQLRADSAVCHQYVSLIHEFYPDEEINQYGVSEWRSFAKSLGIPETGSKGEIRDAISHSLTDYRDRLRTFFAPG
jgi:hypothetical protein